MATLEAIRGSSQPFGVKGGSVISKSNSLKLYMEELPDLLEIATNNEPLKMQFLKAFDIRVTMYPDS